MIKSLLLSFILVLSYAHADESQNEGLMQDFDSLGGNKVLLEKAQVLAPDQKVTIVQNRIVERSRRWELAPEAAMVLGGDSYVRTQALGMNVHYHINNRWSLGGKFNYNFNSLSSEGESMINDSQTLGKAIVPDIDYPKNQSLLLVNWYPIYGKLNLLDKGVLHFDIYALLGGGNVQLASGQTDTYTAGGGIGFWVSQHLTARLEMRYQQYKVQRLTDSPTLGITAASAQMGYLF